jgi:hypothetical protein
LTAAQQGWKVLIIGNEDPETSYRWKIAQAAAQVSPYDKSPEAQDIVRGALKTSVHFIDIIAPPEGVGQERDDTVNRVTSSDGINSILEKVRGQYELIILDTFVQINHDTANPRTQWVQAQEKLAGWISINWRKKVDGILMITNQTKSTAQDRGDIQYIQRGSKSIYETCTLCVEIVPNRSSYITAFRCWKDSGEGRRSMAFKSIELGFDYEFERYVENPKTNQQFQNKVQTWTNTDRMSDITDLNASPSQPESKPVVSAVHSPELQDMLKRQAERHEANPELAKVLANHTPKKAP